MGKGNKKSVTEESNNASIYILYVWKVTPKHICYEVTDRCKNAVTRGFPGCLITSLVLTDPLGKCGSGLAGSEVWLSSILHIVIRNRERDSFNRRWIYFFLVFCFCFFSFATLSCDEWLPLKCLYSPPTTFHSLLRRHMEMHNIVLSKLVFH